MSQYIHQSEIVVGNKRITGLRGYFDGGVSSLGVGCGWLLECTIDLAGSPVGVPSWTRVASGSFCLAPGATVTDAEMSAAEALVQAVHRLVWCHLGSREFAGVA